MVTTVDDLHPGLALGAGVARHHPADDRPALAGRPPDVRHLRIRKKRDEIESITKRRSPFRASRRSSRSCASRSNARVSSGAGTELMTLEIAWRQGRWFLASINAMMIIGPALVYSRARGRRRSPSARSALVGYRAALYAGLGARRRAGASRLRVAVFERIFAST